MLTSLRGVWSEYRIVLINAAFTGAVGLAFGAVSTSLLPWLVGGILFGTAIGWTTARLVKKANIREDRQLRVILLILLSEALLIVYLVVPTYGAYFTVYPTRVAISLSPSDIGHEYEEVFFTTEDGVKVAAWYVPSKNGAAIIAVHGLSGNRSHVIHHLDVLADEGYGVLAFDMRAHGESGGKKFSGWDSDLEVLAGLDYLLEREDVEGDQIGALGLSAGANAVIYAAAKSDDIQAVFLDGTGLGRTEDAFGPMLPELRPLFFMTPVNWVHHIALELISGVKAAAPLKEVVQQISPRPMFFVAAGLDELEPALASRYTSLAGENADYWVVPGVEHLGGIYAEPEEYARRMLTFFNAHLLSVDGS